LEISFRIKYIKQAIEALKAARLATESDQFGEAADDKGSEWFFYPLVLPKTQDELQKQFEGYLRDERFSCLRGRDGYEELVRG
jgi:hypothetical protein